MSRSRNLRGALTAGAFLILLGGWLLARNLGRRVPGREQLWPALPLVYGLASLIVFFAGGRRRAELVFTGVAAGLAGAFFFVFTLGRERWNWAAWWPALVLIAGAAYLAHWLVEPREWGRRTLAALPLAGGGLAAGWALAFARGMGEFGATIIFAGNFEGVTQTLPLAVYAQFDQDFDTALAIGALLIVVSGAVLLAVKLIPAWTRLPFSTPTSASPSGPSSSASAPR